MSNQMSMKIVTRRKKEEPILEAAERMLKLIRQLRGDRLIPKGVYRFSTFEEADRWMTQTIANTRARQNLEM
ncbi:MAG: hypothetical protein JNK65_02660 [Deltaproteobacteria bacterium]|nr:hypothetical protein [Deltaproteobacteria bacterium]